MEEESYIVKVINRLGDITSEKEAALLWFAEHITDIEMLISGRRTDMKYSVFS